MHILDFTVHANSFILGAVWGAGTVAVLSLLIVVLVKLR